MLAVAEGAHMALIDPAVEYVHLSVLEIARILKCGCISWLITITILSEPESTNPCGNYWKQVEMASCGGGRSTICWR